MDVNNGLLLLTKVIVIILVYMINVLLLLTKIMTITRGVHYARWLATLRGTLSSITVHSSILLLII